MTVTQESNKGFLELVDNIPKGRKGSQEPTIKVVDDNLYSVIDALLFKNILESWNIFLLPWQNLVLREMLASRSEGTKIPAYKNLGLSAPRQQGKSEILIAYILIKIIYFEHSVLYTSYRESSALAIYNRILDKIEGNERLSDSFHVLPSRGTKQALKDIQANLYNGRKIGKVAFSTRKGGGGRGEGYNAVIFDEAQDLTTGEYDSIAATTFARTDGQLLFFGTPAAMEDGATLGSTSSKNDRARFFLNMRKGIIEESIPYSSWIEWGVDKLTSKNDIEAWYRVMPSLGYIFEGGFGLTKEHVAAFVGSEESFNTEYLGYWPSQGKERAIDITQWEALETEKPEVEDGVRVIGRNSPLAVSVKSSFDDNKVYLTVATRRADDKVYVELFDIYDTSQPWTDRLSKDVQKFIKNNRVKSVVIDGELVKTSLKQKLQGMRLWRANGSQYRQGKISMVSANDLAGAASSLLTLIGEKRIVHIGQSQVDRSVEDSKKRIFGRSSDRWGFESMSGLTDVTPLEAISLSSNAVLQNSKPVSDIINEETVVEKSSGGMTIKHHSGFGAFG